MITMQALSDELVRKLTTVTSEEVLSREELEIIFPHRGPALIASRAIVGPSQSQLILEQKDFGPYLDGHFPGQPVFPLHYTLEMAAQVAGMAALRLMLINCSWQVAQNRVVLQQSLGLCSGPPLVVNLNDPNGLIATAEDINVHLDIEKNASYMAIANLKSGKYGSSISNIKARLCSEISLGTIIRRISR